MIFILLTVPGSSLPEDDIFGKIYFDKWVHTGLFAMQLHLLYVPLKKMYPPQSPIFFKVALYVFLYGIAMEFVQKYLVINRSFDVGDIIVDGLGAFIGYYIFTRWRKRHMKVI